LTVEIISGILDERGISQREAGFSRHTSSILTRRFTYAETFARGTPVVYYGDEIEMTDVQIPADRVHDPWECQVPGKGLGSDLERTPMQWDESLYAGFCAPFASLGFLLRRMRSNAMLPPSWRT
jgi:glycosidase